MSKELDKKWYICITQGIPIDDLEEELAQKGDTNTAAWWEAVREFLGLQKAKNSINDNITLFQLHIV